MIHDQARTLMDGDEMIMGEKLLCGLDSCFCLTISGIWKRMTTFLFPQLSSVRRGVPHGHASAESSLSLWIRQLFGSPCSSSPLPLRSMTVLRLHPTGLRRLPSRTSRPGKGIRPLPRRRGRDTISLRPRRKLVLRIWAVGRPRGGRVNFPSMTEDRVATGWKQRVYEDSRLHR